jgi:magnesium-transporting ATPase (P-type)
MIIIIGMSLVMLGVSFYLLVVYVHRTCVYNSADDKGWGTAIYCKILVILGMLLVWAQALMLPLDVANNHFYPNSGGINMKIFWYVVYMTTLGMITILLPYAMLFYETDDENTMCKRLMTALCYLTIALAVVCIILFVSWAFLRWADIPVTINTVAYDASKQSSDQTNIANIQSVLLCLNIDVKIHNYECRVVVCSILYGRHVIFWMASSNTFWGSRPVCSTD